MSRLFGNTETSVLYIYIYLLIPAVIEIGLSDITYWCFTLLKCNIYGIYLVRIVLECSYSPMISSMEWVLSNFHTHLLYRTCDIMLINQIMSLSGVRPLMWNTLPIKSQLRP